MRLHHPTWIAMLALLVVLLAANLWCWRPGIGGGGGGRLRGTEMELFYGWPATYRAEWWRSDDPALAQRLLQAAPFCRPAGTMKLQACYVGILSVLADVAFGTAALFVVGAIVESAIRRARPRRMVVGLVGLAVLVLLGMLAVSESISQHL
jgi:hypothetical protein